MAELIYLVLFSPTRGVREVVSRRPIGWAMVLIPILFLILAFSSYQMERLMPQQPPEAEMPATISIILGLISPFIETGIFHIIARLFKGRGSYVGMLCGIVFAELPIIFLAPLALISLHLDTAGIFIFSLSSLAIGIWIIVLTILAIKYNYLLSTSKAIITYFLAPIAFIFIFASAFVILGLPIAFLVTFLLWALRGF